jgi:hypothetical protein
MPMTHTLTAAAMLAGAALFLTLAVFTFLFFLFLSFAAPC